MTLWRMCPWRVGTTGFVWSHRVGVRERKAKVTLLNTQSCMQWVWVLNAGFALPYYCTASLFSISYKLDYYVTTKLLYYNSKKKHLISTYIKFSITKNEIKNKMSKNTYPVPATYSSISGRYGTVTNSQWILFIYFSMHRWILCCTRREFVLAVFTTFIFSLLLALVTAAFLSFTMIWAYFGIFSR